MAERERSRLGSQINLRKQMVPSDLTDFVFDASLWVQLRGFCPEDPSITIDSFTTWRLSPGAYRGMVREGIMIEPHDLAMWETLTKHLLRLELELREDVELFGEKQVVTLRDYVVPLGANCDTATLLQYQRLCFMICDHPASEPFFNGQEHSHLGG